MLLCNNRAPWFLEPPAWTVPVHPVISSVPPWQRFWPTESRARGAVQPATAAPGFWHPGAGQRPCDAAAESL